MKTARTIPDFLKLSVPPEFLPVVNRLRALMKQHAPDAKEVMTYGILGWRRTLIIAVISPTKKDITLSFSKGAKFADKYGLLKGVGKVSKHVKFKGVDEINATALRDYVKQAVRLDKPASKTSSKK